jgi:hypothetical protein
MRKLAIVGATLALLVGVMGAWSIASAAPQHPATSKTKVLHLISHQVSLQVIDLGEKGDSVGDQVIESTVELQHGQRVGRGLLTCVAVTFTSKGPDVLCHGAIVFRDGQVQFQGETTFRTPFTVAVTGGTGSYQKVGGQLTVERTLPNGIDDVETLRLIFLD